MKKCGVYACPNRGARYYLIDPGTRVWLCEDCINQAEQAVKLETEKQRELAAVS